MIRLLRPAIVLLACAAPAAFVSAADTSGAHPRAALVIGNADYTAMNPIPSVVNDEHDMCEALGAIGYATSCFLNVQDAREFKARIQDFTASLKPKSEVVVYYAGHAIQVKGENYLVPTAANPRTEAAVAKDTISLAYLMTQLLQGKHYLNFVILDACRGNPWSGNPRGLSAGLAPVTTIPRGTMVMYATAPSDYSEPSSGRNGQFTRNLLANIASPGLTADELFRKIGEGVQGDAAQTSASVETPSLYTNFTGEFCFGGCIDKIARAELERIQKENDEQLETARQRKAELEVRNREAQAKLAEAAISINCDRSALGDTGRCFAATPEVIVKAIASAFIQQGFTITDSGDAGGGVIDSWWVRGGHDRASSNQLEAARTTDDSADRNTSETVKIAANVREVASIGRCVVSLGATRRAVLHDEYHTWSSITVIPVATSTRYRDVVKNDVSVTDSTFYQDLLAAIERNVRGANAAPDPAAPVVSTTPIDASHGLWGNAQAFDAPSEQVQRALVKALVSQSYIIRPPDPRLGTINALRVLVDSNDAHLSTRTRLTASVTTQERGGLSQVQIAAHAVRVLHREAGGKLMSKLSHNIDALHGYEATVVHDGAVTDAGSYREIFEAIGADVHQSAGQSKHTQRCSAPAKQVLDWANRSLTAHGYDVSSVDERLRILGISRRSGAALKSRDGWTANYLNATVFVEDGAASDSVAYIAASSQQAIFEASKWTYDCVTNRCTMDLQEERFPATREPAGKRDCLAKQCSFEEMQARFVRQGASAGALETVTGEGDADAAIYGEILSIIGQCAQ